MPMKSGSTAAVGGRLGVLCLPAPACSRGVLCRVLRQDARRTAATYRYGDLVDGHGVFFGCDTTDSYSFDKTGVLQPFFTPCPDSFSQPRL